MDDEITKALINEGAKAVVAPLAITWDHVWAIAINDRLEDLRSLINRHTRPKNREDTAEHMKEAMKERGASVDAETPPEHIFEIFEAAEKRSEDEIKRAFGRMAAAAIDPKRRSAYRRDFVRIINELEPIDVLALPFLDDSASLEPNRVVVVASRIGRPTIEVDVSFQNLNRLELTRSQGSLYDSRFPCTTALGKQFLSLVR